MADKPIERAGRVMARMDVSGGAETLFAWGYVPLDGDGNVITGGGTGPATVTALQTAQTGNANGVAGNVTGKTRIGILTSTSNTFNGHFNFEGSPDAGTTWLRVGMHEDRELTATLVNEPAYTSGVNVRFWVLPQFYSGLYTHFRCRTSLVTSGNASATLYAAP
jgi:hypothetical protein